MFDFIKKNNISEDKIVAQDVGFVEDCLTVIMELLHVEVHSRHSFNLTKNKEYLEINEEARKDRTELLDLITLKEDSQIWCFSKHSLTAVLGFMELGNREYSKGNKEKGEYYFSQASKWLGIFLLKNKIESKGGKYDIQQK